MIRTYYATRVTLDGGTRGISEDAIRRRTYPDIRESKTWKEKPC